jgi:16S rRNA (uracil1498-N3)-methyltransferase
MRIFVEPAQLVAGELAVRGDEHHYLGRVRRARAGDAVELVDGEGRRAAATIVRITDTETVLAVSTPETITAALPFVRVLVPLIKGDRMDICLEKLVEVGADAIVVWPAARSVVKLEPDRRDARIAKYQSAVQAAARQCGRAQIPVVTWADDLSTALASLPPGSRFVLDPTSDQPLTPDGATDVTIVSGPEGGLAPNELDALLGFTSIGLGPRVLRAETAPVIAVALVRAATRS